MGSAGQWDLKVADEVVLAGPDDEGPDVLSGASSLVQPSVEVRLPELS
jgi:hypothetical protein